MTGITPYQKYLNNNLLGAEGPETSAYWPAPSAKLAEPIHISGNFEPWLLESQPLMLNSNNEYILGYESGDFPPADGQYDMSNKSQADVLDMGKNVNSNSLYSTNFGQCPCNIMGFSSSKKKRSHKRKFGQCPCNMMGFSSSKKKSFNKKSNKRSKKHKKSNKSKKSKKMNMNMNMGKKVKFIKSSKKCGFGSCVGACSI